MTLGVPTDLLSESRAATTLEGARRASEVFAAVFPPRAEDEDGALALATVEVLTNRVVSEEMSARSADRAGRQWWMEGFVIGYCAVTAETLTDLSRHWELDPMAQLEEMEREVLPKLDADQADASRVVFEVCRTVLAGDQVGLLWALENLWRPAAGVSPRHMLLRVRHVLVAALMTACAAWKLLLAARREAADPA